MSPCDDSAAAAAFEGEEEAEAEEEGEGAREDDDDAGDPLPPFLRVDDVEGDDVDIASPPSFAVLLRFPAPVAAPPPPLAPVDREADAVVRDAPRRFELPEVCTDPAPDEEEDVAWEGAPAAGLGFRRCVGAPLFLLPLPPTLVPAPPRLLFLAALAR